LCPQQSRLQRALLRFRMENPMQTSCELRARNRMRRVLLAFGCVRRWSRSRLARRKRFLPRRRSCRRWPTQAWRKRSRSRAAWCCRARAKRAECHGAEASRDTGPTDRDRVHGGNISAGNMVHREALVAKELQQHYPLASCRGVCQQHWKDALRTVLQLLDANGNGRPSAGEKSAARIVIYGHSWGASRR